MTKSFEALAVVAIFASSCVWMAELTPSRWSISADVTSLIAILPSPLVTSARDAVRSDVRTVDIAPAILATRRVSTAAALSLTTFINRKKNGCFMAKSINIMNFWRR